MNMHIHLIKNYSIVLFSMNFKNKSISHSKKIFNFYVMVTKQKLRTKIFIRLKYEQKAYKKQIT